LLLKLATVLTPGGLPLFLAQDFCFTVSKFSGPEVVAQSLASLLMPLSELWIVWWSPQLCPWFLVVSGVGFPWCWQQAVDGAAKWI
jgi:hypothetical protein